jgi:hypothetical protein
MYQSEFESGEKSKTELYGRGFTYSGTLDDDSHIDRTNIESKIINQFFDLIIFSRADQLGPMEQIIFSCTPKEKIIVIDGEDSNIIRSDLAELCQSYFKRELAFEPTGNIHPIGFGFYKEKISPKNQKEVLISAVQPGWNQGFGNYTHSTEQDYYADYNRSYFGVTHKKFGWDCLRHYEIMGARCIPWFTDLHDCPAYTCTFLPKLLFNEINNLILTNNMHWFQTEEGSKTYQNYEEKIHQHFLEHCTTEALANYVLRVYNNNISNAS